MVLERVNNMLLGIFSRFSRILTQQRTLLKNCLAKSFILGARLHSLSRVRVRNLISVCYTFCVHDCLLTLHFQHSRKCA